MAFACVKGIIILDGEGSRIVCKYFTNDFPTLKEQKSFEKKLFEKTHKANAEIIMLDNIIAIYRMISDVYICVLGDPEENEVMLLSLLNTIVDSLSNLVKSGEMSQMEKRTLLDNYDLALLALDEVVDEGLVLEADSNIITQRVALRGFGDDLPITEQTIGQALSAAREQIAKSLLK
eukprot:TRINITY_DN2197_c0_g1_i1.p1 TRINITY_DN2197_c0_g1~~TRINITY_DN2197_c0_g1_i1.p1  ORF type:complete len:177 (+),score=48.09 TRINITY_DN2197_c0_g1_i1:76-606(+)